MLTPQQISDDQKQQAGLTEVRNLWIQNETADRLFALAKPTKLPIGAIIETILQDWTNLPRDTTVRDALLRALWLIERDEECPFETTTDSKGPIII